MGRSSGLEVTAKIQPALPNLFPAPIAKRCRMSPRHPRNPDSAGAPGHTGHSPRSHPPDDLTFTSYARKLERSHTPVGSREPAGKMPIDGFLPAVTPAWAENKIGADCSGVASVNLEARLVSRGDDQGAQRQRPVRPNHTLPVAVRGARNRYQVLAICGFLLLAVGLVFGQTSATSSSTTMTRICVR